MTTEQYEGIRKYLKDNSGFNIVDAAKANISSNYIYSIDPVLPDKSDVLAYIDGETEDVPVVKAKVWNNYKTYLLLKLRYFTILVTLYCAIVTKLYY